MIPFSTAAAVNALVNNSTTYRCDTDLYNTPEFWAVAAGQGDCEDYAMAKRSKLRAAGFTSEHVHLATAWTETNDYHAVLLVDTDRGTVVLDNRFHEPMFKHLLSYHWHKIEVEGAWHELS